MPDKSTIMEGLSFFRPRKVMLLVMPVLLVLVFLLWNKIQGVTIQDLHELQALLAVIYERQPLRLILFFCFVYVLLLAIALPVYLILALVAGAVFGFGAASLFMPLATALGATLCFLLSRLFLRKFVERHFSERLATINKGIENEGTRYLLTLRLMPLMPFTFINLLMGVTALPLKTFFLASLLGLLPRTIAYINAGSELAQVRSLQNVLSLKVLAAFAIIGLLPLALKVVATHFPSRRTPHP